MMLNSNPYLLASGCSMPWLCFNTQKTSVFHLQFLLWYSFTRYIPICWLSRVVGLLVILNHLVTIVIKANFQFYLWFANQFGVTYKSNGSRAMNDYVFYQQNLFAILLVLLRTSLLTCDTQPWFIMPVRPIKTDICLFGIKIHFNSCVLVLGFPNVTFPDPHILPA